MTEWVEQWICIRFCVKLEHCSVETIQMIQKPSAMGNGWLAASSGQCACSCITSHAAFFGKTSNYPGNSAPQQPRFGALRLLAFPKIKITFKREEISDYLWDSGKYAGAADSDWENYLRSQDDYFEGDWVLLSCVQCFLYLASSSINVSFSYSMARYLLDEPCINIFYKTIDTCTASVNINHRFCLCQPPL